MISLDAHLHLLSLIACCSFNLRLVGGRKMEMFQFLFEKKEIERTLRLKFDIVFSYF